MPALSLLLFSLVFFAHTQAHTWIECLDTDRDVVVEKAREYFYGGQSAAGLCGGYSRYYRGRGVVDESNLFVKILKDDVPKGAALCLPPPINARNASSYANDTVVYEEIPVGFQKQLQVVPGQTFYFGYAPNGHVVKDRAARGTFYGLYWTGIPDTMLNSTLDLNDTKLLDGMRHDFDDGICGQTYSDYQNTVPSGRAGDEYPCVGQAAFPNGTVPGVYTLVWYWQFWNETSGTEIFIGTRGYGGAAYSSCFDVHVLEPNTSVDVEIIEPTYGPMKCEER